MDCDSGYETEPVLQPKDAPGKLEKQEVFRLSANVVFVTYSQSRVDDPEEFHRLLKTSLEEHLPRVNGTGKVGNVDIYGSKELHANGGHHYHVVLRFQPRVCWKNAREKLRVYIDVDGVKEVDTNSIYIRRKQRSEPVDRFLEYVQSYTSKDGVVFGNWIGAESQDVLTRKEKLEKLINAETQEETIALFQKYFPEKYIFNHLNCRAFLKTKAGPLAREHVPEFEPNPWRVPAKMEQWRRANFPVKHGGRPTCLLIIGPSRCGKTEWGAHWGQPALMIGGWDYDALCQTGVTHIVLNDVDVKTFPYVCEMAGCQPYATVTGKYRDERTIKLGLPVVWTCNEDNSPLRDPKWKKYFGDSGVVVVRLHRKLYVDN